MRQSRLISFTKYFLDFMFFSGILVEVSLPFSLKMLGEYYWKEMADHFRAVRDLRTYYRVSAQKNDENCGETGMFCG